MGKTKQSPFNIYIMVQAKKLQSSLTKEQLVKLYTEHGKERKLSADSGIESFMPKKVVFGNVIWHEMPDPAFSHFRIETQNADNFDEIGTVSLSRIHVLGVKKATPEQTLSESDLVLRVIKSGKLSGKKTYMVNGKPLNPVMKVSEDETILNLQGKTFNVVKCERFNVPFEVWATKQEVIEATAKVAEYYELSEVK